MAPLGPSIWGDGFDAVHALSVMSGIFSSAADSTLRCGLLKVLGEAQLAKSKAATDFYVEGNFPWLIFGFPRHVSSRCVLGPVR